MLQRGVMTMDITKFFDPVRGIVEYLISRLGTFIVTMLILLINFDFTELITKITDYSGQYRYLLDTIVNAISSENRSLLLTILIVFVFIGVLEAHAAILNFLDRVSPITFVPKPPTFDPFEYDIGLIWKCYCRELDLNELQNLHDIRKSMEDPPRYSAPIEIFDYISGWIFIIVILAFSIDVKSGWTFMTTLIVLLIAGWLWAYRLANYFSSEASRRASFWLYEHRLHDPENLSKEQQKQLQEYRDHLRKIEKFRDPGASIRISWFDFLYRLLVPRELQDKVRRTRWDYEEKFRQALASLFGVGPSAKT